MKARTRYAQIPTDVRVQLDEVFTMSEVETWWNAPHPMLVGRSPGDVWASEPDAVRALVTMRVGDGGW